VGDVALGDDLDARLNVGRDVLGGRHDDDVGGQICLRLEGVSPGAGHETGDLVLAGVAVVGADGGVRVELIDAWDEDDGGG
jgi:hypothetical protein